MLATTVGLDIINLPSTTTATSELSELTGIVSLEARTYYTGSTGGRVGDGTAISATLPTVGQGSSGTPIRKWWKSLSIVGRLCDINRALSFVTYRPDLNWNSGTVTDDSSGGSGSDYDDKYITNEYTSCLLYTSPSPRD